LFRDFVAMTVSSDCSLAVDNVSFRARQGEVTGYLGWRPALGHLVALALLGMILVEVALNGAQKIRAQPEFEDEPRAGAVTLDVWESRFAPRGGMTKP
jgi:hypothetical protein